MDVSGYCEIKSRIHDISVVKNPYKFIRKICRVMEFADDGGALAIDDEATEMAMFEACDINRSFKCMLLGEYIMPPDLNFAQQIVYMNKCRTRKGGYDATVRQMVILASLHKGEFCDSFLWQKQDEYFNETHEMMMDTAEAMMQTPPFNKFKDAMSQQQSKQQDQSAPQK